ncbi:DUF5590 domain-containing protein [Virgibacillus pantothenticus]|uniref:cell wall elongation regulator TseB-like domain-containing protein n=1 Tax=Virgibacillus pantothenticus TaxID=1473 RepID=UPI002014C263|nr:DUF5590 domain-containing protein [Virgibacillus pantothenticus]
MFVSCSIYLIFLYNDLLDSKTAGYEETKQQLLKAESLTEIDKVETFYGKEAYHVVYGKDEDGQNKLIFYPLKGKEKKLTTVDQSEILSKSEIKNTWKQECDQCELVRITPALVDGNELWELTYVDSSKRYVFDYLDMYDGSRYEQMRFKSMFK